MYYFVFYKCKIYIHVFCFNLFVCLFSVQWYRELEKHCPDVPILLVGTKLDLREDKEEAEKTNNCFISMQDGIKMQAKNKQVVKYIECSALTQFGVKEVFDEAMRTAVENMSKNKRTRSSNTDQSLCNKCSII